MYRARYTSEVFLRLDLANMMRAIVGVADMTNGNPMFRRGFDTAIVALCRAIDVAPGDIFSGRLSAPTVRMGDSDLLMAYRDHEVGR